MLCPGLEAKMGSVETNSTLESWRLADCLPLGKRTLSQAVLVPVLVPNPQSYAAAFFST